MTGLNESTVRVHLFRAARKLRGLLGGTAVITSRAASARRAAASTAIWPSATARRSIRRSPSIWPTAKPARARYAELAAFHGSRCDARATADADACLHARAAARASSSRSHGGSHWSDGQPASSASPASIVRRTMTASSSRSAPRWVAAAAAAGLFVGVAVGASYHVARAVQAAGASAAARWPRHDAPVAARSVDPARRSSADDAFLSDLEIALERPHTRELQAFDALTPHVREVTTR